MPKTLKVKEVNLRASSSLEDFQKMYLENGQAVKFLFSLPRTGGADLRWSITAKKEEDVTSVSVQVRGDHHAVGYVNMLFTSGQRFRMSGILRDKLFTSK